MSFHKKYFNVILQVNTGAVITPPFDETTRYMIEPDQTSEPHSQVFMPLTINSQYANEYKPKNQH